MSTPEAQALPAEIQQELREGWKRLRLAGILAIIVGLVAIAVPAVFAVGTSIFIGIILLFAGSWMLFDAWSVRGAGRVAIRVFWALLTEVAGVYLLWAPLSGTVTLTFVLVVYFIAIGSVRIGEAIALRQMPGAAMVGINGGPIAADRAADRARLPKLRRLGDRVAGRYQPDIRRLRAAQRLGAR